MPPKSISIIAGARPNFMKIAPIVRELDQHTAAITYRLVHTGQHYDREMSEVFFEEFGIPKPDHHLDVGSGSHAEQTARIMVGFERVCETDNPDIVLVVGDVNSTLACAIVAKKKGIRVAHVEAGLRSGDMGMPEEVNRVVTDSITDYFFVTEQSAVENLAREGHPEERIYFVGHVMIDNLFHQIAKLKSMDASAFAMTRLKHELGDYGVVTLHRPSNVDDEIALRGLSEVLSETAQRLPLVFSVHPRTANALRNFGIVLSDRICLTSSLPYMEFLNLWKDARLVLTDSGGLQEETTALGVPCITLRDNTERPVTVSEGTNVLAGRDPERIRAAVSRILDSGAASTELRRPRFWDGRAAQRIVAVLCEV